MIVDFADSRVVDQSALNAIEELSSKYQALGKEIQLRHLSPACTTLLKRTGLIVVEADDDPDYEVAADYAIKIGLFGNGPEPPAQ